MIVIQFNRTKLGQRFLDELLPLTNLITPTPDGGARGQGKKPARKSKRPTIVVTTEERAVNDQAVAALSQSKVIFQRGGVLVQILRADSKPSLIERPVGSPRIVVLPSAVLREDLAAAAEAAVQDQAAACGHHQRAVVDDVRRGERADFRHRYAGGDGDAARGGVADRPDLH